MKKLIALLFCLAVLATVARAEYPQATVKKLTPKSRPGEMMIRTTPSAKELEGKVAGLQKAVNQQVKTAQQTQAAPVKIKGDKRLVSVTLKVPEHFENGTDYHYWYCPAVIFNKDGALAFDGECWAAFNKAAGLNVGRLVDFSVNLSKFGEYTMGENAAESFYFESSYVADDSAVYDEPPFAVKDTFQLSPDRSYIVYKRVLFEDGSEFQKAVAKYYKENNLAEVNGETLSKYFKQKHPTTKTEATFN